METIGWTVCAGVFGGLTVYSLVFAFMAAMFPTKKEPVYQVNIERHLQDGTFQTVFSGRVSQETIGTSVNELTGYRILIQDIGSGVRREK